MFIKARKPHWKKRIGRLDLGQLTCAAVNQRAGTRSSKKTKPRGGEK